VVFLWGLDEDAGYWMLDAEYWGLDVL